MRITGTARRFLGLSMTAAVVATACGSSTHSASTTSGGGATSSSATSAQATAASGVQAAKAFLAPYLLSPKTVGITTPLNTKPPTGKVLVNLVFPVSNQLAVSNDMAQAAKLIGWKYTAIPVAKTAEGIQQAFDSALQMSPTPTVIAEAGYEPDTFAPQLAEAKSRGIGVIVNSTSATPGNGVIASVVGPSLEASFGKSVAAWVVSTSAGTANIAYFTVPSIVVLGTGTEAFQSGIKQWCTSCKVTVVDQQLTDVGTNTPQAVVSMLERNPSINYVVFAFGSMTSGVHNALVTAGLAGKVKIASGAGDLPNLKAIRSGEEQVSSLGPHAISAYYVVDAAARYVEGMSTAIDSAGTFPLQLVTQSNIGSVVTDSAGEFIGIGTYMTDFAKLWRVG